MLYGGILAAFAFGAIVVFDRAGQFSLWEFRPISFGSVLEVTIFIVLLFALVYILYE